MRARIIRLELSPLGQQVFRFLRLAVFALVGLLVASRLPGAPALDSTAVMAALEVAFRQAFPPVTPIKKGPS